MSKKAVKEKLFVVKKYVMAKSAKQAMSRERKVIPDDVYVHEAWQGMNINNLESAMGFIIDNEND